MPAGSVGYATLQIIPSMQGVDAAISKGLLGSNAASAAGATLGKDVEKGIGAKSIGSEAGKGLAIGIGAGIAAGAGAFKLGETFDAAFDEIRVGTGATGEALEGLQDDFKAVFSSVPTDSASAATAVADLNTRLGLTGAPLQDLSEQFLNLSRITGTDLATNIHGLTRVFGDWGLGTDEQAGALDKVFRAAQSSGIGLDQLQTSVVQFGAPLRNLGFGFEEALSLLSQFDKAGVNTETAFSGLRRGVANLAKDGEAVPETFRRVVDEITKLGPGTEATAKSIELFGTRAGPDLADAIAGGKFEIDQMMDAITNGSDTIEKAADDTDDFGEKWKTLVNGVLVALEPAASAVFEGVGAAVEAITPFVTAASEKLAGFVDFLKRNPGVAKGLAIGLAAVATALGGIAVAAKVIGIIKGIGAAFTAVRTAVLAFNASLLANPIFLIIAGIIALGVAIYAAYKRFEGFRNVVDAVGRFLRDTFMKVLDFFKNWWESNGQNVIALAKAVWEGIQTGAQAAWTVLKAVAGFLADVFSNVLVPAFQGAWAAVKVAWDAIAAVIKFAWENVIQPIFDFYVAYVTNVLLPVWDVLWKGIQAAWNVISAVIVFAWQNVIQPLFDVIKAYITNIVLPVWNVLWKGIQAAWNVISAVFVAAWQNVVLPIFNAIKGVIETVIIPVFTWLKDRIVESWNAWSTVIQEAWNNIIKPAFDAIWGFIQNTLVPAFERARDIIVAAWERVSAAVSAAWNNVIKPTWDTLKSAIGTVADFIGEKVGAIVGFFTGIKDKILGAFNGVKDAIMGPFKAAFNGVADIWNKTVAKIGFDVPSWVPGVGGKSFHVPEIPKFHTGGIVPGAPGEEVLIKALAGERVLSPVQTRERDRGRVERQGDTFNINQTNVGMDPDRTARRTVDAIKTLTVSAA